MLHLVHVHACARECLSIVVTEILGVIIYAFMLGVSLYACVCLCMCIIVHLYDCVSVRVHTQAHLCVCMCVCLCVCAFVLLSTYSGVLAHERLYDSNEKI